MYGIPFVTLQPLSKVIAEEGAEDGMTVVEPEQDQSVSFDCDQNVLPVGLCDQLKQEFAPDGFWKQNNQNALNCITNSCSPGMDAFSRCEEVGYGQRCEGVKEALDSASDEDIIWSSEINADLGGFDQNKQEDHKNLVISALGFQKMISFMTREAIHNSNGDFGKAKKVYESEEVARQIEEAKQQESFYDSITHRAGNLQVICEQPYNGNIQQYVDDEFYMSKRYLSAINVTSNGLGQLLKGNNKAKKVFGKGAIGGDGMLADKGLCKDGNSAANLPSDAVLGAVADQTSRLSSKGLLSEVGEITDEGKDALELAEDFEENTAVTCAIKSSEISYIYKATKSNERFVSPESFTKYCSLLGKSGCAMPSDNIGLPETCTQEHEASIDEYLENYMQSDEFSEDEFINPTTGRLKDNTKELLKQKLFEENEVQLAEALNENIELEQAIEMSARYNTIMELVKAEMGNNSWYFKSGQKIMTGGGGYEISSSDLDKIKKIPEKGNGKSKPDNIASIAAIGDPPETPLEPAARGFSDPDTTSMGVKKLLAAFKSKSDSGETDEQDTDWIKSSDNDGLNSGGFGFFGSNKSKSKANTDQNSLYSDNNKRNDLIKFPDELIVANKAMSGEGIIDAKNFCSPSMIKPANEDSNCYCVRGPLVRPEKSLDETFYPCPSDVSEFEGW